MADKKIAIQSIKLKLGNQEVDITIEQARELKAMLDDLLGKEVIKVIEDKWRYMPQIYYPDPVYTRPYTPVEPFITWETTTCVQFNGYLQQLCLSVSGT